MLLQNYLIVSTVWFFALAIAWSRKDVLNLLVKIALFAFGVVGLIISLHTFGFIIKAA